MMGLLWSLLGILAGTLIAFQAPINAALGRSLGVPVAAAAASFLAGTIALAAVTLAMQRFEGAPAAWSAPPMWMYVAGGLLGAAYVTSVIVLTPKLGTAATMAFIVAGQLLAGLALDHGGAFGMPVHEISLMRVAGAAFLLGGALMIRMG
jgi:transporter family-2 protein